MGREPCSKGSDVGVEMCGSATSEPKELDLVDEEEAETPEKLLRREESLNTFLRTGITLDGFQVPGVRLDKPKVNQQATNGSAKSVLHANQIMRSLGGDLLLETFTNKHGRKASGFDEAGAVLKPASEELENDSRNIKKTCGLELKPSFQACLLLADFVLVLALTLALTLPSYMATNCAFNQLHDEEKANVFRLGNFSALALSNLTRSMTFDTLETVMLLIQQTHVNAAMLSVQNVLNGVYTNRLLISELSGEAASLRYFGQPSWLADQVGPPDAAAYRTSIGPFMVTSAWTGLLDSIQRTILAWKTNEYVSAASSAPESYLGRTLRFSYAPPSATVPPGPTTTNVYKVDPETFELTNKTVEDPVVVNWVGRPWYAAQERAATDALAGSWTDVYEFVSSNELGVTYSWPLAPCNNYTCLEGVVGNDLETSNMSAFCYASLYELLESTADGSVDIERLLREEAALYIVQNSNASSYPGALLASSTFTALSERPQNITFATNYTDSIIGRSARLVASHVPFGNVEQWETGPLATTPWSCFKNLDDESETAGDCSMIECISPECLRQTGRSIVSAMRLSSTFFKDFPTADHLELVVVVAVPARLFLGSLVGQFEETLFEAKNAAETVRDDTYKVLHNSLWVAGGVGASSLILAWLLSIAVTRPLRRLEHSMGRIRNLDFDENEPFHSRIREIRGMQETFVAVKNTLKVFAKFVPATVVHNIVRNEPNARVLHVHRRVVTVFFSDIADFTSISEALSEKELLYLLVKYLTVMTHVVESYGGVVGEVLGDGILAFWNTPDSVPDHASLACACALAQLECIKDINTEFRDVLTSRGFDRPLSVRIGIHTGSVLTGNIGSFEKLKWGCLGDVVNNASRLEGICKLYGVPIIISDATRDLLRRDAFVTRELDHVRVKGKQHPTRLFQVVRLKGKIPVAREALSSDETAGSADSVLRPGFGCGIGCCSWLVAAEALPLKRSSTATQSQTRLFQSSTFGPLGPPPSDDVLEDIRVYEAALAAYQIGSFASAAETLGMLSRQDQAAEVLGQHITLAREEHGDRIAPGTEWTGITNLRDKSF